MDPSPLISAARIRTTADLYAGSLITRPWYSTIPLPARDATGVFFEMLYCRAEITEARESVTFWPPKHLVRLSARTGQLESMRTITPEEFGRSDDPETPIGSWSAPIQRDAWLTNIAQTCQLLDAIMPAFADRVTPESRELVDVLVRLRESLRAVMEPPLLPYYRVLFEDFLRWVRDGSERTAAG